jgi:hypothetical protein
MDTNLNRLFIALTIFFTFAPNHTKAGIHQKRLLEFLFKEDYDPLERPVKNDGDSLNVSINLSLQQIVDVVSIAKSTPFLITLICNFFALYIAFQS